MHVVEIREGMATPNSTYSTVHVLTMLYGACTRCGWSFSSLAIMMVLEFPPRLSLRSQVSTESLYGMKNFRFELGWVDISAGERERVKHKYKDGRNDALC